MKEENRDASNKSWRRIFKKKWFFPALYLALAAFLLTGVIWYQSVNNQMKDVIEDPEENSETEDTDSGQYDEDATSVIEQTEVMKMPVDDQDLAEIVTKFYDYNAPPEEQESGVTHFNNSYSQSMGIDITHPEEDFDAKASVSGTVLEVKKDPLLGNVVVMEHQNGITTHYASLGEVAVDAGANVKQGETIGTAGKNLFGKDIGTHLHFQIRKDGEEVNPETYFNQPLSKLDEIGGQDEADEPEDEESERPDEAEESDELDESNEDEEETGSNIDQDETDNEDEDNDSDLDDEDMNDSEN